MQVIAGMGNGAVRGLALGGARAAGTAGARSRAKAWGIAAAFLALAVVGRVVMAGVPNVQPVTALCILAGIVCGRRQGFAVGAGAALASNIFLGQGAWTIFQMLGWGLAGWGAGALFGRKAHAFARPLHIYAYGFAASLAFGFLMDSQIILLFGGAMPIQAIAGIYAAGVPFNLAHAAGTVAFLLPLCALASMRKQNSGKVK